MARTQVQSELLAVNSISGTIIADNAITATHIATNAISGTLVQDGGIVTVMIAANNVTATKIVTDAVQTRHIADDQVTAAKLANSINTDIATGPAALPKAGGTMTGNIVMGDDTSIGIADDAERIEFDGAGDISFLGANVGIGDASPSHMLHVNAADGASDNTQAMTIENNEATDGRSYGLKIKAGSTANDASLFVQDHDASNDHFIIRGNGAVGIGTTSPARKVQIQDTSSTVYLSLVGPTNAGAGIMFGDSDDETVGRVTYDNSNNGMQFWTNDSERMRIHANGKAAWSANGIGSTGTVARDFAFYTEGSTNGVEVRSNDQRLLFFGAGGSGGTGVDDGYLAMSSQGTGKIAFNANGDSYFNGGKLAIGADHADEPLTVRSSAENINTCLIEVGNDLHATNTKDAWIKFVAGAATNDYSWAIGAYPTDFRFSYLGARGTAVATAANVRLQIANNGRLTYNDTGTANAHATFVGEVGSGFKALAFERTVGGGEVGTIVANTSSTTYNTSSDYRLKENVDYSWDATTRLKQLKPARFNWIADDTNTLLEGFLAHEVSSIVPEAVSGEKDAMADPILYEDGDELPSGKKVGDVKKDSAPEYQGIDHSKLVPLLVKTVQELEARIKTLEG